MRIAVTGATGHLGANLVRLLVERGHEVRALYRRAESLKALAGVAVERQPCDVLDIGTLKAAFAGVDAVMHLAAVISIRGDPDGRVMRTNVEGARNVVDACLARGVAKLVHFSSIHAFKIGQSVEFVDESHPPADESSFRYDQSKALGEKEILAGVKKGLDATILNPTGVIGPFDFKPSRAGTMLRRFLAGRMRVLVAGGFDWVDARDVALAALGAVERGGTGERYILSGHWVSFLELAALCDAVASKPVKRWSVPISVARLGLPFTHMLDRLVPGEPLFTAESLAIVEHGRMAISHAKAARALGFRPRALEETLSDTLGWFGRP